MNQAHHYQQQPQPQQPRPPSMTTVHPYRQNHGTTLPLATARRYRRLSDIQLGMISDVVVRVVSYDQTRTLWPTRFRSRFGNRNRHMNTKTQTTCLLADGPRDVDHVPFLLERAGAVQRFDAILQRHYAVYTSTSTATTTAMTTSTPHGSSNNNNHNNNDPSSPPIKARQPSSSFLLRLTNVECQSYRQRKSFASTRGGPSFMCGDDHQDERILVPTLLTQAMEIPWSDTYYYHTTTDAQSATAATQRSSSPHHYDKDPQSAATVEEDHHPRPGAGASTLPTAIIITTNKSSHLETQQVALLRRLETKRHDDVLILHSPLLDLCVNGVSLLNLPASKWMDILIRHSGDDDDTDDDRIPTFQSAMVTLQIPGASRSIDSYSPQKICPRMVGHDDETRQTQVLANRDIVQTLCGGLAAVELQEHSEYAPLAAQVLASLLPTPTRSTTTTTTTTFKTRGDDNPNTDRHGSRAVTLRWCLQQLESQPSNEMEEDKGEFPTKYQVQHVTLETLDWIIR